MAEPPKAQYIAEGFLYDAEKLCKEFSDLQSLEFPVFARVWKKHRFSLIFMGRTKEKEMYEFTHELFRLSLLFLDTTVFIYQVAAVYLMYGIFRNQYLSPPVRIRLILPQWQQIALIRDEADKKKCGTLAYVLDYMYKNAFDFVACRNLMGPKSSFRGVEQKRPTLDLSRIEYNLKKDMMDFLKNKWLQEMHELSVQYEECKAELGPQKGFMIAKVGDECNNFSIELEILLKEEEKKVQPAPVVNIGSRRAKIKADQFEKKVYHYTHTSGVDSSEAELQIESPKKTVVRRKRLPKNERRVGRPPKVKKEIVKSDSSSDDGLIPQFVTTEMILPKERVSTRRKKAREPVAEKKTCKAANRSLSSDGERKPLQQVKNVPQKKLKAKKQATRSPGKKSPAKRFPHKQC